MSYRIFHTHQHSALLDKSTVLMTILIIFLAGVNRKGRAIAAPPITTRTAPIDKKNTGLNTPPAFLK